VFRDGNPEKAMNHHDDRPDFPCPGPNDPPIDFSREMAAYERERERLVREHLGQIALVHGDDVIGAFSTADEAFLEGFRRFGTAKTMLKEIRDPDLPDQVAWVDVRHPSFQKLD
jgi:hypothetical protein